MSCIPIFWVRVIKVSPNLLKLDCFLLYNDWIVADYNSPRNKTWKVSRDGLELEFHELTVSRLVIGQLSPILCSYWLKCERKLR